MRDYWTSALSVVPVQGNLRISSADLQSRLYCGDTEFSKVPVEHMSTGIPLITNGRCNKLCLSQIDLNDNGTVSESITQDNVDVAVHEAAHILGMSSNSYRFVWDPVVHVRPITVQSTDQSYSGLKPEALDCRIKDNGDSIDIIYSEVYGDNSMCFETSSGEGRCYNSRCIYDEFNLQVQVDGRWYLSGGLSTDCG